MCVCVRVPVPMCVGFSLCVSLLVFVCICVATCLHVQLLYLVANMMTVCCHYIFNRFLLMRNMKCSSSYNHYIMPEAVVGVMNN